MRRMTLMALAVLALAFAGCKATTLNEAYVKADRSTYDALSEDHRKYVDSDNSLDSDQKARRKLLLDSWRVRLEKAEKAVEDE